MKIKSITALFLTGVLLVSCATVSFATPAALSFGSDGKFTVLQLADPQDDKYAAHDLVNLINLSIARFIPDLIVIAGDLVEDSRAGDIGIDDENGREGVCVTNALGKTLHEETLQNTRIAADNILGIIEKAHIPFAVTQGNNDRATGVTPEEWLDIYSGYDCSLIRDDSPDSDGRIDYTVEVAGTDGSTELVFWMMDTGGSSVTDGQLDWFAAKSGEYKQANGGNAYPSIVFEHIPVADTGNLFEPCRIWNGGARWSNGKFYRLNAETSGGVFKSIILPGESSSQFASWKTDGGVMGAFFGHFHSSGYSGVWNGIELGLTYGCQFAKSGPYGVRVFTFDENNLSAYQNELYIYEGSVSKNNAVLELQADKTYDNFNTAFEKVIGYVGNIFRNIFLGGSV